MEFNTNEICTWIDTKISFSADQIEIQCKEKVNSSIAKDSIEAEFIEKWIKRNHGKQIDSDLLALRTLETLILLSILRFKTLKDFKLLKEKLIDWSEAVGLIRSISNENRYSLTDTSMEVDFNPTTEPSQTSTILNTKPCEFEFYLLEKFRGIQNIKEIIEIIAERCGIPVDSDFEDEKHGKQPNREQSKHWRRVKPVTLPIKRVTSSTVNRPSSLSFTELKSTRFISSSSRQVDLALKQPTLETNNTSNSNRRRHSETSAPQILQQTTPTKTRKSFQSSSTVATNLATDSFVILETPPRAITKQVQQNDLTNSVRRLFSPMEE